MAESIKTELMDAIDALSPKELEDILASWQATQELRKRPGYENAFVILRK